MRKHRDCRVVIDLQYGSTGKGLIAGWLAQQHQPDTVVTAWAANAGHTFIDRNGRKYVHTMLANGVVSPNLKRILIGPGSVIDPHNLAMELEQCADHVLHRKVDVLIHPHAAVITDLHRAQEAEFHAIGSTKKGVGAAMIQRILRDPGNSNIAETAIGVSLDPLVCTMNEYRNALDEADSIQIEGAQGFSLSIYHGFYPYTTSRDVSTAQVVADCGVPPHWVTDVIGTMRTYPIRVANRFDAEGRQIGWSGPWYDDQREMDWKELGRNAELTTVTKLPRRIATFSMQQLHDAVWQTGARELFLNFVNYLPSRAAIALMIARINSELAGLGAYVAYVGDGPTVLDVHSFVGSQSSAAEDITARGIRSAEEENIDERL